jgi:hypothetical protein
MVDDPAQLERTHISIQRAATCHAQGRKIGDPTNTSTLRRAPGSCSRISKNAVRTAQRTPTSQCTPPPHHTALHAPPAPPAPSSPSRPAPHSSAPQRSNVPIRVDQHSRRRRLRADEREFSRVLRPDSGKAVQRTQRSLPAHARTGIVRVPPPLQKLTTKRNDLAHIAHASTPAWPLQRPCTGPCIHLSGTTCA